MTATPKSRRGLRNRMVRALAPVLVPVAVGAAACSGSSALTYESAAPKCRNEANCENELLSLDSKVTSANGRATVNGLEVVVTNRTGNPIEGIKVSSIQDGEHHLTVAMDTRGTPQYVPNFVEGRVNQVSSSLSSSDRLTKSFNPLNIILDYVDAAVELYQDLTDQPRLFQEHENVNKYCMTIPQITRNFTIPTGILFLLGAPGKAAQTLKSVTNTALEVLLNSYIHHEYGKHEAYLVSVPKTAMSFCGSFSETVCPITYDNLHTILKDAPAWQIEGSCDSTTSISHGRDGGYESDASSSDAVEDGGYSGGEMTGENSDAGYFSSDAGNNPDRPRFEDLGNGTVRDNRLQVVWLQRAPRQAAHDEATDYCDNLTFGGASNWRLPDMNTLNRIHDVDDTNNHTICGLPPVLSNMPCGPFYWTSTECGDGTPRMRMTDLSSGYRCQPLREIALGTCLRDAE